MAAGRTGKVTNPNGRPKGSQNRRTKQVRETIQDMSRMLLERPGYWRQLKHRLDNNELPPVLEAALWAYAWGKPQERVQLEVARKVINILPPDEPKVLETKNLASSRVQ